jgi:transcriptional regulator with GAF, ATPase, and Fis domain
MTNFVDTTQIEIDRIKNELETLKEISELVTSSIDFNKLLINIINTIARKMQTDICTVYLLDNDNNLVLEATIGLSGTPQNPENRARSTAPSNIHGMSIVPKPVNMVIIPCWQFRYAGKV